MMLMALSKSEEPKAATLREIANLGAQSSQRTPLTLGCMHRTRSKALEEGTRCR